MKKTTIAFLIIGSLMAFSAKAQEPVAIDQKPVSEQDADIRLGILTQPNIGFLSPTGKRVGRDGTQFGFNYGVMADFPLNENNNYIIHTGVTLLNIGGGLSYDNLTQLDDSSFVESENEADYRLRYVNIPLSVKLRTNPVGYITYFGIIGFDGGFNIRALRDMEATYIDPRNGQETTQQVDEEEDVSDEIALFRASFKVAAGLEYNISGNTNIVASIEWNNGLTNAFSNNAELYSFSESGDPIQEGDGSYRQNDETKAVANYFALSLGVYF